MHEPRAWDLSLAEIVEAHAVRTPLAPAVVYGSECLGYQELNRRANRLAWHLLDAGAGPGTMVATFLDRSADMVVAWLAIVKIGAAYVPLDPEYPRERLRFMLEDSRARAVVTTSRLRLLLPSAAGIVALDEEAAAIAARPAANPACEAAGDWLAHVIYTSGSTGRPKGVCVPHRAVTRLVVETKWFALDASDRVAQTANASFDAASFEVWGALLNGACLVGASRDTVVSPADLERFVRDQQISVMFLTTALFHLVAAANPGAFARLRALFVGGEAMGARRAREVLAAGGPGQLVNVYGPTENGIYTTTHTVRSVPPDASIVLIGEPVDGTDVILLNEQFQPVAPGDAGELCTGGEGLAHGYWDRPELTAERFVPHPFSDRPGARLYRTGDRARQLPDGSCEFLVRLDAQVKIRGHRIEPGEVDAVLLQHPAVADALTMAREDRPGEKRLVAYVKPAGRARPDAAELRGFVADRLPAYMIPSAFVVLDALPLTAGGKIDRRALPPPPATRPSGRPYVAPRTEVEHTLVALWGTLTGVADAGVDDDFFELGGHSLLAAQAVARVNDAFGTALPISTIFECPTVAAVAERLSERKLDRSAQAPLTRAPRGGPLPLSYSQEQVWFLNELQPGNLAYNFQANIRFAGRLDVAALERSLGEIVRRHEVLRTAFVQVGDQPAQVIHEPMPIALASVDLRELTDEARAREMDRLFREQFQTPFDLQRPPLVRWLLIRTADEAHELIHVEHHLVHDGWSFAVLLRELKTLYQAFSRGEASPLAEPAWQFADYTCWQRNLFESGALDAQIAFWRRYVAGAPPVLELPTDHPRPETLTFRGACERVDVAVDLYAAMRAFSRDERVTLFMTMVAAFQAVLWRHSGADDMVIGTAIANRPRQEFEAVLGMFVNPVLMRTDLSGNPSFRELVQRVRATALEIYARQETPFGKLVEALQPERDPTRNPLFQVLFSFHDAAVPELAFDQVTGTILERQNGSAKFDLNIICIPRVEQRAGNGQTAEDVGLTVLWEYNADLFERSTARRLFDEYQAVLRAAVANPGLRLGDLPFVPAEDRRRLLHEWNAIDAGRAEPSVLHAIVAAQARRSPEAIAIRTESASTEEAGAEKAGTEKAGAEKAGAEKAGTEVTYADLNRRANRLAHHLLRAGAGPDVLVGVAAAPSVELFVGILAVLKSGAAYVPLDPEDVGQLALVLGDASPALVLADARAAASLPSHAAAIVPLDDDVHRYAGESDEEPASVATAESLACVAYTAGATGDPKGVLLTHANVARLFTAAADSIAMDPADVWTLSRSWASGASLWDIWGALLHGGRLIVPAPNTARTADAFHSLVCREGVTMLSATPTAFRQFAAAQAASDERHRLRHVVLSGEPIEAAMLAPWFRDARNDATRVTAAYGLLEATAHVIHAPVERRHAARLAPTPAGHRLSDLRLYILDAHQQPVPIGVPGEIFVGGAGVARGYLRRPSLTADAFVDDPFCGLPGARMMKTGDRGRWLADRTLECLGRADGELRIRGFRVDPGDVASRLMEQPGLRDAIVTAHADSSGEKQLVAYYVCQSAADVTAEALRASLAGALPAHLMPAAYVRLDAMPITPHGMLDYKALPVPAFDDAQPAYVAPRNELEAQIAEIWRQVLGVERVGARDYFFDLGGHSLKTIQIRSRLSQELGVDLPLRAAFEHPTVEQQAQLLSTRPTGAAPTPPTPIPRLPDLQNYALSHAQRRLWFLHKLDPEDAYYNRPLRMALRGRLDEAAFRRAFDRLVDRHEALRTQFAVLDDEPVQVIVHDFRVPIDLRDLSGASDVDRRLRDLLIEFEARPFALDTPPVRACLVRLQADQHIFVIVLHHIAVDGWSTGVLLDDLASLYAAEMREGQPELPPHAVRGVDVAAWQLTQASDPAQLEDEAYWLRQLAGELPRFELPSEPSGERDLQRTTHVEVVECSREETAWLEQHARDREVTAFMLRTAILQAFLARFTGQHDVLIGVPVAGRSRPEMERLVGFFANTLALRTDVSGNPTFDELLERVRRTALDAYAHEAYPFDLLIERLNPVREADRLPLLQVLFTIEPDHSVRSVEGLTIETMPDLALDVAMAGGAAARTGKIDLSVSCLEKAGGRLAWAFLADGRRISKSAAGRLAVAFQTFLRAIVAQPGGRLADLPVLPAADRRRVLDEWNGTVQARPSVCIHELIEAQARRTPDALAIACGDARLTYAQLDRRANWMAHRLRALGVGPDAIVGLYLERTPDLLIAMLATFKAGGAYLPLDPKYPRARLEWMLADAGVSVALTDRALEERLPSLPGVQVWPLDAVWRDAAATADEPPASGVTPRNLAYVIYTSGSTGTPKGVAIEHASASAFLHQGGAMFTPDELAGVVSSSSVCFDFSICEILVPLAWGGTVILIENVLHVPTLSADVAPTMICAVPSALAELMREHTLPATVRTVAFGGEALSSRLTRRAHEQPGVQRVINVYGPTETTTFSTFSAVPPDAIADPPIGRPIANTKVYVLDAGLEPVSPGAVGEIYIGGAGLSRGYHARPELTAERFLPDPFGAPGSRFYRTGDRGRHLADGTLEFVGRRDHQVKLRGYRIELGEIEEALEREGSVRDAVAIVREDVTGDPRLVAYVVPSNSAAASLTTQSGGGVDDQAFARALQRYLHAHLPSYMVPSAIVSLAEVPRHPNGKVNRAALPEPSASADAGRDEPRTDLEREIAAIWGEVLGVGPIALDDNVYELGAHSLMATKVHRRIQERLCVRWMGERGQVPRALAARIEREVRALVAETVPLRAVFDHPTVRRLAASIEGDTEEPSDPNDSPDSTQSTHPAHPTRPASDRTSDPASSVLAASEPATAGSHPASHAQRRMWLLHRLDPTGSAYNVLYPIRLAGALDAGALRRAVQLLVERHETLRTTLHAEADGSLTQRVQSAAEVPWTMQDLSALSGADRAARLRERLLQAAREPFDLEAAPLLRAELLRLSDHEHRLLLSMHHIVMDGRSWEIVYDDLTAAYDALCAHRSPAAPVAGLRYVDYSAWQNDRLSQGQLAAAETYWRTRFADGIPELALPVDHANPRARTFQRHRHALVFDRETADRLRAIGRQLQVTPFVLHLSVLTAFLRRITGQDDLVVGTPVAGRDHPDVDRLVGCFINTVLLRTMVAGDPRFADLVETVKAAAIDGYAHQDYPLDLLAQKIGGARDEHRASLVQVLFATADFQAPRVAAGVEFAVPTASSVMDTEQEAALPQKLDLHAGAMDEPDGRLTWLLGFSADLFDADTARRLGRQFESFVADVARRPEATLSALTLLSEAEHDAVKFRRVAGQTEYPPSFNQREMWVQCQLQTGSGLNNIGIEVTLTGPLDVDAFQAAFAAVVDRHESLRTRFDAPEGDPRQCIDQVQARALVCDLSDRAPSGQAAHVRARAEAMVRASFSLDRAPLFRAELLRMDDRRSIFIFVVHHLILDAFHLPLFLDEVARVYERYAAGDRAPLPELPLQYGDFAEGEERMLASGLLAPHQGHWQAQLRAPLPAMALPIDRQPPAVRTFESGCVVRRVPADVTSALKRLERRYRTTLFRAVAAAFEVWLWRMTGERDLLVAMPFSTRPNELKDALGFFGNTLPLRSTLDEEQPFNVLLGDVTRRLRDARDRREFPLTEAMRRLDMPRDPNRPALPICLSQIRAFAAQAGDVAMTASFPYTRGSAFDLWLAVAESREAVELELIYAAELFTSSTIEAWADAFVALLASAAANPEAAIRDLGLVSADHDALLRTWGDGGAGVPAEGSVGSELAAVAASRPDAIAVMAGTRHLTYADVQIEAGRIAASLQAMGVGRDDRVGILGARSAGMLTTVIGVLQAGAAFVPLEASQPDSRLQTIALAARVAVVACDRESFGRARALVSGMTPAVPIVCWDDVARAEVAGAATPSLRSPAIVENGPTDLAYIFYTSGSTGTPKGVMVEQRGMRNHLRAKIATLALDDTSIVAQTASYGFDIIVWQWLAPLLAGGRVAIYDDATAYDPAALLAAMARDGVTVVETVPSFLEAMIATDGAPQLPALRWMVSNAEALPPSVAARWHARHPGTHLLNTYGATECSDDTTHGEIAADVADDVVRLDVGMPIPGSTAAVVDELLRPVPPGCVGEVVLGGIAVGRGYLGDPVATARAFVPDPNAATPGARMYRTGDRGRWRADGVLECLGRMDDQVKVHGYRVELGDVEAALAAIPELSHVAAAVRTDARGQRRLVAYYVGSQVCDEAAVRAALMARLPPYMVPSAFMRLAALPRTRTGKLNRAALPAPAAAAESARVSDAAATPIETVLAGVWQEVLKVPFVGRHDNFFDLGGDSIQSILVASRLTQRGFRMSPRAVFGHQTIAELARVVEQSVRRAADDAAVAAPAPLLPIQQAFFAQELAEPHHWNQAVILAPASGDERVLRQAAQAVHDTHPALRMRFTQTDGAWTQQPAPAGEPVAFEVIDLDASGEPLDVAATRVQASLDLARGPVFRVALLRQSSVGDRLLLVVHHLVMDTVSWGILIEDFAQACAQASAGQPIHLIPESTTYAEWATELAKTSARFEGERSYWQAIAARTRALPRDHDIGANTADSVDRVAISIAADTTRRLLTGARRTLHADVTHLLLCALARAAGAWTGDRTVTLYLEGHGREELVSGADLGRTIGWFTSAFPVALDTRVADVAAHVARVGETLRDVPNRGAGFGVLRWSSGALNGLPTPEISFNYHGQVDRLIASDDRLVVTRESAGDSTSGANRRPMLVNVECRVAAGRLEIECLYSRHAHRCDTMAALVESFATELETVATLCDDAQLPADVEDVYPLAPIQEGMLFHALFEPDSSLYYEQAHLALDGPLDIDRFRAAWRQVVATHPILRTVIRWEGLQEPVQVVRATPDAPVRVVDLGHLASEEQELHLARAAEEDWTERYSLDRGPLVRLTLFALGPGRFRLVWSFHHLLLDGWSVTILLRDLARAYEALASAAPVPASSSRKYRDFVTWLRQQDRAAAIAFWRQHLEGFEPATSLPRDRPRPLTRRRAADQVETVLAPELSRALDRWARAERVTMSAVLRTGWAILLSRLSGTADIVFGATVSGRPAEMGGIEQMVGPFINAVPVRVIVDGRQTVASLVRRVHDESVAAGAFEYLPLPELQKACGIAADKPLFDSLFAFENYPSEGRPAAMADVRLRGVGARELTHYDLTLIADASDVVRISLAYALDVFERDTAARMVDQLAHLLAAMAAGPRELVSDVSGMSAADAALVSRWSDGGPGEAARDGNVAADIAAIAVRTPTAIAVAGGDERWTYAHLSAASGRIAAELKAVGICREGRVGVLGTRSPGMVGTIVGLLHLGAAFVPIEPSQPDGRIRTIAQSAALEAIVTDRGAFPRVSRIAQSLTPAPVVLCWDDLVRSRIAAIPDFADVGRSSLTYILFTSGSTGTPKGVMVEQHGLRNHLRAKTTVLDLDASCVVAQTASCGFDIMVWQVLAPLLAGGRVEIYDHGTAADGRELLTALGRDRVTVVEVVPSVLRDLLSAAEAPDAPTLKAMRWVVSNAEPLPSPVAARWLARYPDVPLMNCFGLTETSDDVAHVGISGALAASARVPVGAVISGATVAVVDELLRPVPPGCVGEIVVGGPQVARGYIGDPVATARAFVPDPIGRVPGGRLYRTGDRGRWRGDGLLECLGRRDDQVKVHGHRVELGEVESALATLPELSQSAVAVRRDANGQARLVAYYVAPVARETAAIRSALAGRLPAHMVPDAFIRLDALPLTPSGKLDRRALPAPPPDSIHSGAAQGGAGQQDEAPLSPLEATVATVWQHALQVPSVGRRDTFFDLGGHSLTAIRIAAMLKERLGRHVPIWQLFLTPTLEDFAEAIRTAPAVDAAPALARVPDRPWYPVSSAQRAQWIVQQLTAGHTSHPPRVLQLEGALDRAALDRAMQALVDRHDVLRTTFEERDGDAVQIVHDKVDARIAFDDLSGLAPDERSAWMRSTLHADSRRPFELSTLPLVQVRLVALEPLRHVLLFRLPHIISDGWTEGILIADLAELYNAQCAGRPSTLPALPLRYADASANEQTWLESAALQSQKTYWIDRFSSDVPVLTLPASSRAATDERRPAYGTTLVEADTIAALRATAASHGATLFAALLSAFQILLSRLGGNSDIVVGTTVAGRGRPELDRMAGLFANMLPLRTSLAGNPRFVEILRRTGETTLAALSRQEYPFQLWIDDLRRRRAQPDLRLFSAFFVVHEEAFSSTFDGLTARWFGSDAFGNTFDARSLQWDQRQQIAFAANDTGRGWRIALLGAPSLFDEAALQHLLTQWTAIVHQVIADPERRLADIELPVREGAPTVPVSPAVALEHDELDHLFA